MLHRWNPRDLHAGRTAATLAVALLGLFVLTAMAIGFVHGGTRKPLGEVRLASTHRRLELDARVVAGGSFTMVTVTPAGAAAGFTPGQTIDMTLWRLARKLAFAYPAATGPASPLAAHQGLQQVILAEAYSPRTRDSFLIHALDIAVRLVLLCSALFIIQFSHGRAALAAGLYLACAAMADSAAMTFAGLPGPVQTAGLVIASIARPAAYATRVAFSMDLCPGTRRTKQAMWAAFAVLLTVVFALSLSRLANILFDWPLIPVSPLVLPLAQCLTQLYSLGIFAAAAIAAPQGHKFVLRIIFAATLITLTSYLIEEGALLAGFTPPAWMSWYFSSALLGVGIGYPWAIFARRIAGVDFIISRGVAYAISLSLLLGVIELVKAIAKQVAGDWATGFLLIYGIPILLTLCLAGVQGIMTRWLDILLDGDLRNAAKTLHALEAEFPQNPNLTALAEQVAARAAPALHMASTIIYQERAGSFHPLAGPAAALPASDPALAEMLRGRAVVALHNGHAALRGGLLLPLVIFGRVIGALHCGARPHNKGFDPAEHALLEELAREIAIAMICLEPANLPAMKAFSSSNQPIEAITAK